MNKKLEKEVDIYKDLYQKMKKVFGWEALQKGSPESVMLINLSADLADNIGIENVTEESLIGIAEVVYGEADEAAFRGPQPSYYHSKKKKPVD